MGVRVEGVGGGGEGEGVSSFGTMTMTDDDVLILTSLYSSSCSVCHQ